jgi:hypothetical protein
VPDTTGPTGGRFGLPADLLIDEHGEVLAVKYGRHAYDQWSLGALLAPGRLGSVTDVAERSTLHRRSRDHSVTARLSPAMVSSARGHRFVSHSRSCERVPATFV